MKAISLWQPWASAIAVGAKRIETRSWSTRYRGPLAIHAAKRNEYKAVKNFDSFQPIFRAAILEGYNPAQLPAGQFVAVANLIDCVPVEEMNLAELRDPQWMTGMVYREFDLGDYSPGRYGWVLDNIRPLPEPIPYRGRQGLFEVPDELVLGGIS